MEKASPAKPEKAPPPDPTCPICKKAAHLSRPVNAVVEFWECEDKHMFAVDKKPPPRISAAAAAAAATAAAATAAAATAAATAAPVAPEPAATPGDGSSEPGSN